MFQRKGVQVRVVAPTAQSSQEPEPEKPRRRTWRSWPQLVLSCYLLAAVAVTWRLWVDPVSRAQAGDDPDLNQVAWFVRYSATAISHGRLRRW